MNLDSTQPERLHDRERGLGIAEILVAMLMLAILSLATLPVLINGIKQSAANTTLATATQLANRQMELAVLQGPTCAAITSYVATPPASVTDALGVVLQISLTAGTCPSTFPGTRAITVSITRSDTGATLVTAATNVFVSGT
jgi:type II secretory pathway pseudopilin PulG